MDPNASPLNEAQRQQELLLQQQQRFVPDLYRDLALYLQVLREGLLPAVQQACFHLATQVAPERYAALPPQRRQALQQRLQLLVSRANALLTVEQLMASAAQQRRRGQRRQQLLRRRVLDAVMAETGPSLDPPGSVRLALEPPIAPELLGAPADAGGSSDQPPRAAVGSAESLSEAPASPEASESPELGLLRSLFQLASDQLDLEPQPSEPAADAADADPSTWLDPAETDSALPRDPLRLVRWWQHWDRALTRRLRNLSHAVNVELLRAGLAQALLPLNLLDAALAQQLEVMPAPANLLRLPLPEAAPAGLVDAPTEVITVLLRCSDLEYEQPRLRTCRKRLEQRRRALRTMAQRYRYWQRRVAALEAEQQWYLDSAQPLNRPIDPA